MAAGTEFVIEALGQSLAASSSRIEELSQQVNELIQANQALTHQLHEATTAAAADAPVPGPALSVVPDAPEPDATEPDAAEPDAAPAADAPVESPPV